MPIFEYAPDLESCEQCQGKFEVVQRMADPPLTQCPTCGKPCHRVLSAFLVGGKGKNLLNPKNLTAHGFTQYKKKGSGYYEKTAGPGPKSIVNGSKHKTQ